MTEQIPPTEMLAAISGELIQLAELVEGLGEALCCDEHVLTHHLPQLQSVDVLSQSLRHRANILNSCGGIHELEKTKAQGMPVSMIKGFNGVL